MHRYNLLLKVYYGYYFRFLRVFSLIYYCFVSFLFIFCHSFVTRRSLVSTSLFLILVCGVFPVIFGQSSCNCEAFQTAGRRKRPKQVKCRQRSVFPVFPVFLSGCLQCSQQLQKPLGCQAGAFVPPQPD